jgi:hypothetical protein
MASDTSLVNDPISKGGLFGGPFDSTGLDSNTRALLIDFRWTTSNDGPRPANTIPYSFPTQASDYTSAPGGYPAANLLNGFAELTADQKAAVRTSLDLVSSYTGVTFIEVASGLAANAAIRLAHYGLGGSEAFYPSHDGRTAGDTFLGGNGNVPAQYFGTDGFLTIAHELGHAFGLKHGHETDHHGALDPRVNDNEFSVMTYASYFGSPADLLPTSARPGSSPQSYMMYDIAALQALYGANFSKVGTVANYTWDKTTGQELINGRPAPFTGTTSTDKIFSTVWTMGAASTYDLTNFSDNQTDDLRPGHWLTFSHAQLADLNSQADAGTPQYQAQGNVYNALLYQGDMRSEVSNLFTGSGNDTIFGNDIDNFINSGAGDDIIHAGPGNDTIVGGPGADTIYFGTGRDVARDTLADMNGDIIVSFGFTGSLDVQGVRFGRESLLAPTAQTATISKDGDSIHLNGDFSGGDFMITARGSGADAHTTVAFVQFLPPLSEGVGVNPAWVNGVGNQPFLTGDGSVRFTLDFKSAVSAFSNELGFYKVGADGTIRDVHILFGNTLDVAASQQTIDLGVPGNNERIGFFLVQNGFNIYGKLPDNLSFLAPGTNNPAGVDTGTPAVLGSATLGQLTAAQIFHSFANLNPGHADQILAGLTAGGHELRLAFEDLPRGTGDNDFNDVVIAIHVTPDDNRIV